MGRREEQGDSRPARLRATLLERGWRSVPDEENPGEPEYCKEYPVWHGHTYHVFARDIGGDLRLHLAYLLEAGTLELVSAALKPDQLPDGVRLAAEADIVAAGGRRVTPAHALGPVAAAGGGCG